MVLEGKYYEYESKIKELAMKHDNAIIVRFPYNNENVLGLFKRPTTKQINTVMITLDYLSFLKNLLLFPSYKDFKNVMDTIYDGKLITHWICAGLCEMAESGQYTMKRDKMMFDLFKYYEKIIDYDFDEYLEEFEDFD